MSGEKDRNARLYESLEQARKDLTEATANDDKRGQRRAQRRVDNLFTELVEANMKLVYEYTKVFSDRDDEDFESAGKIALIQAVLKWDPSKGSLSTWAMPRIKKATLALAAGEQRLKTHAFVARSKVVSAESELAKRLGRPPTDAEVAEVTHLAESLVGNIRMNDNSGRTRSLNWVVNEEGAELGDVAGPTVDSAEDQVIDAMFADTSNLLLAERSPAEIGELFSGCNIWETVVGLRHLGGDGADGWDFQEMVVLLGVSRETLRKYFRRVAENIS